MLEINRQMNHIEKEYYLIYCLATTDLQVILEQIVSYKVITKTAVTSENKGKQVGAFPFQNHCILFSLPFRFTFLRFWFWENLSKSVSHMIYILQ